MNESQWRALSIDTIDPDSFPSVALYLKLNGNYILYKNHARQLANHVQFRLEHGYTEYFYVRSGDMEIINAHLESTLEDVLAKPDLDSASKMKRLYEVTVNCVCDLFEVRGALSDVARVRKLVNNIFDYMVNDADALKSLRALKTNNYYLFDHSFLTTALSILIQAKLLNLPHNVIIEAGCGALVRDYGMVYICGNILSRDYPLEKHEYHKAKEHTIKGHDFLQHIGLYSDIALSVVMSHHEKCNGTGYPDGLTKDTMPEYLQVVALCDIYAALTMGRERFRPHTNTAALQLMRREMERGTFEQELFTNVEGLLMNK